MKKDFKFSIDTSQAYFWIILFLIAFIIFSKFSNNSYNFENERLKQEIKIIKSNELKTTDSIKAFKESLKSVINENTVLKTRLDKQKTEYKTIIIEKDAKKNTIDSYDHNQLSSFLPNRYDKD